MYHIKRKKDTAALEYLQYMLFEHGGEVTIRFPQLGDSLPDYLEKECFRMLRAIRDIVSDPVMDESECFSRVEQIVAELEKYDIDCDTRHDME